MNIDYDLALKGLDFVRYDYDLVTALFEYKDDKMIALNKNRAIASIDCILEEFNDLKDALVNI